MIYVEILGRMGNQMFSYAMAKRLQKSYPGQKIAFDFKNFKTNDETWINYIEKFKCASEVIVEGRKLNIIQRLILHFYFKKHKQIKGWINIKRFEEKYADILEIFGIYIYCVGYHEFKYKSLFKNKLLLGFYESPAYFDCIADTVRDGLSVEEANSVLKDILQDIEAHTAIAVGVRRGDFVSESNRKFCDVCTPKYYKNGIKLICKELKDRNITKADLKIYIFTDDIDWTRENLKCDLPLRYITSSVNGELKPWEMMQVLSHCKYQVISNSSFFGGDST